MTLGTLVEICENIREDTVIMIYHTIYDFEVCSSNWNSCKAGSVRKSEMTIERFNIIGKDLVAVAIA